MTNCMQNRNEVPLYIIICLAILRTPLYNMCEAVEKWIVSTNSLIRIFSTIYAFFMLISIIKIIKYRNNINRYIFCLLFIFIIVAWSIPNLGIIYLEDSLNMLSVFMIFPFVCACLINNWNQLFIFLKPIIFINYIFGLFTSYLFISSGAYYSADGMMATYSIAIPTSYYCYMSFKDKDNKFFHIGLSLFGIGLMFFTGSRGGFILIIMAIFLGLLNIKSFDDIKFIFRLGVFILLGLVIFINQFIDTLQNTRIFDLLSDGNISGSSGREWYFQKAIYAIEDNPLLGCGLFGDRIITGGFYTHNLFLEILCDFGIIVGSLFIIWFLYLTIEFVLIKKNKIITVLFLMAIPQLLVSSSYLLSCYFWVYIGALVSFSTRSSKRVYCKSNHFLSLGSFDKVKNLSQ